MDADGIRDIDLQARATFTYRADPAEKDSWRSHADDALAGRIWFGDCDDLASTALDLLSRQGVQLTALYRLNVDSTHSGHVDHQVACAVDDAGVAWIVGDTFGEAYPAAACRHRPVFYQRMDDIETWRDGAPWA